MVSPPSAKIGVGKTQSFVATCTNSDGTTEDVTSSTATTWDSSDNAMATISGGTATGVAEGTVTITATHNGKAGTASLEVVEVKLLTIDVSPITSTLVPGGTQQLTATGNYSDGTNEDLSSKATWASSAAAVATINATGEVTAVAEGSSDITADYNSVTGKAGVTVIDDIDKIAVSPVTPSIAIGATQQFKATATTKGGKSVDVTSQVSWTSSTTTIATIDNLGMATGVAAGDTDIKAELTVGSNTLSDTTKLTVTDATLDDVQINGPTSISADSNYTATALWSDKTTTDVTSDTGTVFTSDDTTVADFSTTTPGLLEIKKSGTVNLTAAYGGKTSKPLAVTITGAVNIVSIAVTPATATIAAGTDQQFIATATMSNSTTQVITSSATWQSSATTVASMSATSPGLATGVAMGTATITATQDGVSGTATLTVTDKVCKTLTITPSSAQTIGVGATVTFTATCTFTDNTTQNVSSSVVWSSAPTGIVGFTDATAKGITAGSTQVSATYANATGTPASVTSNQVLVVVTAAVVTKLTIDNPPTASLPVGATYAFTVTATWTDATTTDETDNVTWASSSTTVATISNATGTEGQAIAKAAGTTNITAAMGTITSTPAALTVASGVALSYIVLSPTLVNLNVGQTQQFTATGHYSDGSNYDITSSATWQAVGCTTLTPVANFTVTAGLVTAVSSTATLCGAASGGYGRVMASQGTVQSLARVTIKTTAITSIQVTCASPLSCLPSNVGYKVACQALATYADATTGDITATASWNSTSTAVATASTGGVITIVGAGTAIITATQGGKTSPTTGSVAAATVEGVAMTQGALTVSGASLNINKGQTSQFSATSAFTATSGTCGTKSYDVTALASWSSSNASVASVSNAAGTRGLATGLAKGTSTISATFGSQSNNQLLTVDTACLQKVVAKTLPTLPTNVTTKLSVNGYYSDAPTTPVALTVAIGAWSTSCAGYNTDANWNLTVGTGNCTAVTYSVSGTSVCGGGTVNDSIAVATDSTIKVTSLTIAPASTTINKGGAANFTATASFEGGASYNVSPYAIWANNPAVTGLTYAALVPGATGYPAERYSHSGSVGGDTTVSATYKALLSTASLTVAGAPATKVTITSVAPSTTCGGYPVGVQLQVNATVDYSDGTSAVNPAGIVFSSSNPAKLEVVSGNNLLTKAPSAGTNPIITATLGSLTDTQAVVVLASTVVLTNMEFTPSTQPLDLARNVTQDLTIMGVYGTCTTKFDISSQVTSASSNATLVDVSTTGTGTTVQTFNTLSATPVTLSFIKDGLTRTYNVTVSVGTCYASVAITPQSVTLPKGSTQTFVATAATNQGTQVVITGLGTWSSSNPTALSNTGGPTFLSNAAGTATVNFTYTDTTLVCKGGDTSLHTISASAGVTTTDATVSSVVISKSKLGGAIAGPLHVPLGEQRALWATATMTDTNLQDVTTVTGTTWSSQQSSTASVSATGLLTGVAAGTTIVSVQTQNGKTDNITVIVAACTGPTVAVTTAATGNLPVGETRQYVATATYAGAACSSWASDELVYTVTTAATWASSATAVATINGSGVATGVTAGSTNITATYRTQVSPAVGLTVVQVTLTSLSVSPSPASAYVGAGGAITLTVSATYTGGGTTYTNISPPVVSWAITDGTVLSITGPTAGTSNTEYTMTGLKAGSTTFFAQKGTVISNTVTGTISAACLTGITLTTPSANQTWAKGRPFALSYTCTMSNGSTPTCNPTFSTTGAIFGDNFSSNFATTGIGRVLDTAAAGATGNLVATVTGCGGVNKTSTRTITVGTATLTGVSLPATHTMPMGTTDSIAATGTWANGTGSGNFDVSLFAVYASNNGTIVQVTTPNPGSGRITAQNVSGTALVTASYLGNTSNNCTVTVSGKALTALTITAEPNLVGGPTGSAQYPAGGYDLQLKATGTYSDTSTADLTSSVTWSLDTPLVPGSTVSTGGELNTGTPTGTTATQVVRAALGSVSDTFSVDIVKGAITTIAIVSATGTSPALKVAEGLTVVYAGHVTIMGGTTYWATRNVTWSSTVATIGTIVASGAQAGQFTAVAPGVTNIAASRGTANSGPLAITVTNAEPKTIQCNPASVSVTSNGGTAQLSATVTNTDGTSNDVTADTKTTWKSTVPARADFKDSTNNPGLVTGGSSTGVAYGAPEYTFTNNLGVSQTIVAAGADRCTITVY